MYKNGLNRTFACACEGSEELCENKLTNKKLCDFESSASSDTSEEEEDEWPLINRNIVFYGTYFRYYIQTYGQKEMQKQMRLHLYYFETKALKTCWMIGIFLIKCTFEAIDY